MSKSDKPNHPFDEIVDSRTGEPMKFVGEPEDKASPGKERITHVFDGLINSRTGRTLLVEEEVENPEKRFAELREIGERGKRAAERLLKMFSKPCDCGMPWCPDHRDP